MANSQKSARLWSNVNLGLVILLSIALTWIFIFMPSMAPTWLRIAGVVLAWVLVAMVWYGERLYVADIKRSYERWEQYQARELKPWDF
jgi:hypothetical protein